MDHSNGIPDTLLSMNWHIGTFLLFVATGLSLCACSSGPLKWNQTTQPAPVVDNNPVPQKKSSAFAVLIVPSGAIRTHYISDKASTAGGILGSMVVGPIAGAIGGLLGSTAGSAAASSAEEEASRNHIDSSDIAQAIAPIDLPRFFATTIGEKLNQCGIRTAIYPAILNPNQANWSTAHLGLSPDFTREAEPYRFFIQTNVLELQVRSALKDNTLEGNAYARVYETRSLRQIGRYTYKTGSIGSVTLNDYASKGAAKKVELQNASQQVARYLAGGIATDMCAIMSRL